MFYEFNGIKPIVHKSSFVHPLAAVTGNVIIGKNCLVGMNSVIMDEVELGDESIVGALTFIRQGEKIPIRSLIAGNPGKIIKQVSDEMMAWKTEGTKLYQQ